MYECCPPELADCSLQADEVHVYRLLSDIRAWQRHVPVQCTVDRRGAGDLTAEVGSAALVEVRLCPG